MNIEIEKLIKNFHKKVEKIPENSAVRYELNHYEEVLKNFCNYRENNKFQGDL